MPLFPVLDLETVVQENDKTRLDASKSFASGGSEMDILTIQPSALADAVVVTDDMMLDWQYEFTFEIVEDVNDLLNFSEGDIELTAQLTEGEYTLAELAVEIQARMRAQGALSYDVSVSDNDEISIEAESEFQLLGASGTDSGNGFLESIGFAEDQEGKESYTGEEIERIEKTVTVTMTDSQVSPADDVVETLTKTIQVVSERADRLFSTDDKLRQHESDILKYVVEGRATFKDVHRRAQTLIMAWLDTEGFIDDFLEKFTVKRIRDIDEVTEWATHMALKLIFESISNAKDDVFLKKASKYENRETFYRGRAVLRIDINQDGRVDIGEQVDIRSCRVVRR